MIHVIAIITAKPGQRETVLAAYAEVATAVLAEPGCIEYSGTIDVADADPAFGPDSFVVIEKWESPAALKAHSAAPHMAVFRTRIKDAVASVAVHRLQAA